MAESHAVAAAAAEAAAAAATPATVRVEGSCSTGAPAVAVARPLYYEKGGGGSLHEDSLVGNGVRERER